MLALLTRRTALVAMLIAAFGLSACGKKGPLKPPPGVAQQAAATLD